LHTHFQEAWKQKVIAKAESSLRLVNFLREIRENHKPLMSHERFMEVWMSATIRNALEIEEDRRKHTFIQNYLGRYSMILPLKFLIQRLRSNNDNGERTTVYDMLSTINNL